MIIPYLDPINPSHGGFIIVDEKNVGKRFECMRMILLPVEFSQLKIHYHAGMA
jgi:hypothetical protein